MLYIKWVEENIIPKDKLIKDPEEDEENHPATQQQNQDKSNKSNCNIK